MKYVVVQRTGFMPYFLCSWSNGNPSWDCRRARSLVFDGPEARRIANLLNVRSPATPLPVLIEMIR